MVAWTLEGGWEGDRSKYTHFFFRKTWTLLIT
jgi:hypothetical protein